MIVCGEYCDYCGDSCGDYCGEHCVVYNNMVMIGGYCNYGNNLNLNIVFLLTFPVLQSPIASLFPEFLIVVDYH